MDIVKRSTFLKGQNTSLRDLMFFMIGFMYGMITLIPVAIYYVFVIIKLMIFYIEFFYGEVTAKIIFSCICKGIVLWFAFLIDYLLYCGFYFQEKLSHIFDGRTYFRMADSKTS